MGCGSSQAATVVPQETNENGINEASENGKKYPPPEAFEIALEPETGESLIKKHPPKRVLQRLTETVSTTPPTIEDLEEKLANAEIRRNKFLQQRIEKIKDTDESMQNCDEGIGGDDDEVEKSSTEPETGETIDDSTTQSIEDGVEIK